MLDILVEFQSVGTTGINIDVPVFVFQYKEWDFLWLVVIFMMDLRISEGKYGNIAVYFWNCLDHFPQVREFFDFMDERGGFETTIGAVEFEKSAAGQEFNHQDFIFTFIFLYSLDLLYTALSSEIVLWQTKTPLSVHGLRAIVLQ